MTSPGINSEHSNPPRPIQTKCFFGREGRRPTSRTACRNCSSRATMASRRMCNPMESSEVRPIGFSTGALALGDFRSALSMLAAHPVTAVELSALRDYELKPLMAELPRLDLDRFRYLSVHVPSKFSVMAEADVASTLEPCIERGIPVVLHPDAIRNTSSWRRFGTLLCIENMDKRKGTGRTL